MANKSEKMRHGRGGVAAEIVPSTEPKFGQHYSNIIQISHSPWDFTLRFCLGPSGDVAVRQIKEGKLEVPNLIEAIVPTGVIPNLIGALQENYDAYKKSMENAKGKLSNED
jgi:hypothetical protein